MSTVILDTITGKSTATTITIGSTPVVSASANSMTIRGEGSNQTSIQQGLAKVWCNFEGDGTVAISDSFNTSGITDNTTGDYTIAIATDMANINYSLTASGVVDDSSYQVFTAIDHDRGGLEVGEVNLNIISDGGGFTDSELLCFTVQGDLA
jgi:hypothetical protein